MTTGEPIRRQVMLAHRNGLHLTPIGAIVKAASAYAADVKINFDGKVANTRSAMDMMLLGATVGSQLTLEAAGADAETALQSIARILETDPA
jgi:phosphotransferase system HPr (HPr) family protein